MAPPIKMESMLSCSFSRNAELLIWHFSDTFETPATHSYRLNCPPAPSNDQSNNACKSKNERKRNILISAISSCNNFVAACDPNNLLHLWEFSSNSWNYLSGRQIVRKCQKLVFNHSGSEIIVADRGGDVFGFSAIDCQKNGKFLLGHIALILDIDISIKDEYLVTCDRDGKIKISHYPNSYNIQSYCLGHQEFVSTVRFIQLWEEMILSGSGDGTVRLWEFTTGTEIFCIRLFDNENLRTSFSVNQNLTFRNPDSMQNTTKSVLSEQQTIFAVGAVKYCNKHKLLAVLFAMQHGIVIYQLSHTITWKFDFIQYISLEALPLDLIFDMNGNFFVILKSANNALQYFKCSLDAKICFKNEDLNTVPVANQIKEFFGDFETLTEVHIDYESLFKHNYEFYESKDEKRKSKKNCV